MYIQQRIDTAKVSSSQNGFTLTDLLVVVAVIVVLAALQVSAISSVKPKSKGVQCMNNLRQLSMAWLMYAEDNHEYFTYSSDDNSGTAPYVATDTTHPNNNYAWAWSKMNFSSGNAYNTDPNADITLRPLWWYNQDIDIYKCPSDTSVISSNGVVRPRVRSYSMNIFLGGFGGSGSTISPAGFKTYTKLTDLTDLKHSPGAANTFLFIEERQDCINTGNFETDMSGYPNFPSLYEWTVDVPGAYHDGASALSFCDGHVEMHKWHDGVTMPNLTPGAMLLTGGRAIVIPTPYGMDVPWMQNVTTRPN